MSREDLSTVQICIWCAIFCKFRGQIADGMSRGIAMRRDATHEKVLCFIMMCGLVFLPMIVNAHRSGCHRWHSCPSDRGAYICGDLGYCSQCRDNQFCASGQAKSTSSEQLSSAPTVKQSLQSAPHKTGVLRLDYEGFTIWLDCDKRGAVKFRYNAQRDQGDFKRHGQFYFDADVSTHCQQKSSASYKHPPQRYDRGHLVPANHLDYSRNAIRQSNYMTNILPQAANMNRGAWLLTEEIVECYRDIDELLVIGGVIWGNNPADDYFVDSHGVKTPDAFWKVIIRGKDRVIAWVVPNIQDATKEKLDTYLVSVEELEQQTGEKFPEVPQYAKTQKPKVSWLIPIGCNKV